MTPERKQNVTYRRQRYKSKERRLEITSDQVDSIPEVVEREMEHIEDGRNEEKEFAHLLLKLIQDLSNRIEEMCYRLSNGRM